MTSVTIRMPEDVIGELKYIAPLLGFSGYQPLIRAYIGQGLRKDLDQIQNSLNMEDLIECLRRHGVNEEILKSAMKELRTA
jgi:hypothetical protein